MAEQNNAEQNNSVQNNAEQTVEEQKKVYSRQQERRELDNYRQTKIERIDRLRYRAYGANGATLEFGVGEGLLTPVELLLAAIAGCSSVDVDAGTSRRSTPEVFEVLASALKQTEDGAVRLDDVEVDFDVRFPEDEQGAKVQKMVDRLIQLSEQKDCTVSRTVEHPTNVSFHNLAD